MIGDDGRGENRESSSRPWPSGVTTWRSRRLGPQSGDAPGPLSFDRGSPFELQPKLAEERIAASRDSTTIPTLSIRLSVIPSPFVPVATAAPPAHRGNHPKLCAPDSARTEFPIPTFFWITHASFDQRPSLVRAHSPSAVVATILAARGLPAQRLPAPVVFHVSLGQASCRRERAAWRRSAGGRRPASPRPGPSSHETPPARAGAARASPARRGWSLRQPTGCARAAKDGRWSNEA